MGGGNEESVSDYMCSMLCPSNSSSKCKFILTKRTRANPVKKF